jgi:hypothetical protein
MLVAGFVAAARFLGGQLFAASNTKLSHHPAAFEFGKNKRMRGAPVLRRGMTR